MTQKYFHGSFQNVFQLGTNVQTWRPFYQVAKGLCVFLASFYKEGVNNLPTSSVTRCRIKKVTQIFSKVAQIFSKVAQIFSKVVQMISTAVFTLIDRFQNIPKANNLFRLLLRVNLLPRTFENRPIRPHCQHDFSHRPFRLQNPANSRRT